MNVVERFFGDITEDAVRDGSFESVKELRQDIEEFLVQHNLEPKRYVWRKRSAEILAKIQRARVLPWGNRQLTSDVHLVVEHYARD